MEKIGHLANVEFAGWPMRPAPLSGILELLPARSGGQVF
jgi:hypothetical protein